MPVTIRAGAVDFQPLRADVPSAVRSMQVHFPAARHDSARPMHFRRPLAAVILAILLPFAWCFGSTLTGARVCAYRDAANFYYPLYAWTSGCWLRGEVPLWNPQEGLGTPVVAEATSAVFYPGQLIFALPIDYSLRFSLYIAAHLILAAAGAFALALDLLAPPRGREPARSDIRDEAGPRKSPDRPGAAELRLMAAGLCGVSYAFSGGVLFQYCNVVFLVGAAWLPLALLAAVRMMARRRFSWALALGVCLAMMVLGGDSQAAYHAGLLAALWAWFQRRSPDPALPELRGRRGGPGGGWSAIGCHALSLLALAAVSGASLAAVQIIPAIHWTRESDRAAYEYPRTVYEISPYLQRAAGQPPGPAASAPDASRTEHVPADWSGVVTGLLGSPVPDTHHQQLYAFSVAPWRLIECLWPNFSGRMFPRHQRWLSAVGGEDRVWTPTLYLGLMPLLLALVAWRRRREDRRLSWLSWIACGSLVASFGWYGPGWLIGSLPAAWTGEPLDGGVGAPTGGLYWLMVTILPGYAYFRYPAKLLTIASLAVALLAALGFQRVLMAERGRLRHILRRLGFTSAAAACLVAVSGAGWSTWLAGSPPDELYGPLDCHGAWLGCLTACGHATALCGLFWWLMGRASWPAVRIGAVVLIVTAIELGWANGSSVLTVPTDAMHRCGVLDGPGSGTGETLRLYRPPERRWVPPQWLVESETRRGETNVLWDVATLLPKHHLLGSLGSVDSLHTLVSRDLRAFLAAAGTARPHPHVLRALSTRYLILPAGEEWPAALAHPTAATVEVANARVWIIDTPWPRVWLVHQVESWPPRESSDPAAVQRRVNSILFPDGEPRDLRHEAVVETDARGLGTPLEETPGSSPGDTCRLMSEATCRLEVEAELAAPGLLVVSNLYESGWMVNVTTDTGASGGVTRSRAEIVRTNGVMQGVFLPAGRHHLTFEYAPRPLYWAAAVSGASWLVLLSWFAWPLVRRRAGTGRAKSDNP